MPEGMREKFRKKYAELAVASREGDGGPAAGLRAVVGMLWEKPRRLECQTSPACSRHLQDFCVVPEVGLEPTRGCLTGF